MACLSAAGRAIESSRSAPTGNPAGWPLCAVGKRLDELDGVVNPLPQLVDLLRRHLKLSQ